MLELVLAGVTFEVGVDVWNARSSSSGCSRIAPLEEGVFDLVILVADHALPARGEVDAVGAQVPVPDAGIGAENGQVESLPAFLQGGLGLLTLDGPGEYLGDGAQKLRGSASSGPKERPSRRY